jgi:hypothetical protein
MRDPVGGGPNRGEVMNDKWQSWAATGGILMIIVGAFRLFGGVIGLFRDEWIVRGLQGYYFVDISALAWWYIIVGAILLAAGLAVLNGKAWGRWVGVFAVGIALISELFWIPLYPIWSIIIVVLYAFVIVGLVMGKPKEY